MTATTGRKVLKLGVMQRLLTRVATFESAEHYRASMARRLPDLSQAQLMVFVEDGAYVPILDADRIVSGWRQF